MDAGLELEARMRSCIEMTLRRFLYLSISFSNVASRALDATYRAELVFVRWKAAAATGLSFFRIWVAIAYYFFFFEETNLYTYFFYLL